MKKIFLSISLLAFLAACGDDRNPTSPSATVGPEIPGPSFDDIPNNLDNTVDADAEIMALNVGGANGTTELYVVTQNGDGKNGCNLTGQTTLTLSVTSSNTAAATVSPSSVTFTSCGATKTLTVTPVAQGTATITVRETSNDTGADFNLASATFTVNVTAPAPANGAPTVSVAGVTGGASYPKGSVPDATCQVTDAEDGNPSVAATLSAISGPYSSDGIGSQTASCSYTDKGGLTASASETYTIVDPSPPTIEYTLTPASPDGSNGWYKRNVTLTWTVDDPESPNSLLTTGAKTGCVDQKIEADQTEQTYACSATSAGGSADPVLVKIKVDRTVPTVSLDNGPADGGSYYFGSVPSGPTCSASDALSGLESCIVTGYNTAVGSHTLTATATDNAGNTNTATRTYTVLAWTPKGFYQPTDMGDVLNTVKGGSTVPLKFEVFAGDRELTDVSAIGSSYKTLVISCSVGTQTDDIEVVSTGGTSLRYDTTAGQFIQNWQTPKQVGACYKVTVSLADGSKISALFKLK